MGLFSVRGRREIDTHGPPWAPSSFRPTGRHGSYAPDRQPPQNVRNRDFDPGRPLTGPRQIPQSYSPRDRYPSQDRDLIQVFPRHPRELYEESGYDIAPDTATNYPCTQRELNASGGVNRQMAIDEETVMNMKLFAHPNKGPFTDARKAAREIFDHNDQKRTPSATENEAINRLVDGFENAVRQPWGPDLAIKAFCDLDKVFFCGRLKGHVCLTWMSERSVDSEGNAFYARSGYMGKGKCVMHLNAYMIFFRNHVGSCFGQMFATVLHEMCHAYQMVRALEGGPNGWLDGKADGHGKNFGTMILAVNRRARAMLGLKGDPNPYPCHEYAFGNEPRRGQKQSHQQVHPHIYHPHIHPHTHHPQIHSDIHPPPRSQSRSTASPRFRKELYNAVFTDITLDSGNDYACMQSDLEATGGLARQLYPEGDTKDRKASQRKWFSQPKHGPFVSARQASRDVFEHNDLRRKPDKYESRAIERLSEALIAGSHGDWSPDLIIKAFCDLDTVFFGGQLRGHVCVRWQPDWCLPGDRNLGQTRLLGDGKCSIRLNAGLILLQYPRPFECIFAVMLHEMCHANGMVRVHEKGYLECASHGKNFGTTYYAVEKRARKLFGISLKVNPEEVYPHHKYEKGEGFP